MRLERRRAFTKKPTTQHLRHARHQILSQICQNALFSGAVRSPVEILVKLGNNNNNRYMTILTNGMFEYFEGWGRFKKPAAYTWGLGHYSWKLTKQYEIR